MAASSAYTTVLTVYVHSCWDTGGLKRAQKAENMFHLQEDEARSVSRAAKKDKEAASWVEKKRREAGGGARP